MGGMGCQTCFDTPCTCATDRTRLIGRMMLKLHEASKLGREARLTLDEIQFLLGRMYEQTGGDERPHE